MGPSLEATILGHLPYIFSSKKQGPLLSSFGHENSMAVVTLTPLISPIPNTVLGTRQVSVNIYVPLFPSFPYKGVNVPLH